MYDTVSENISVEEALKKTQLLNSKLLDHSPTGIYIYDLRQGINVYVNAQYTNLLGYTKDEINDVPADQFLTLFHPEDVDLVLEHMGIISEKKEKHSVEYRFKHKLGHWVWCHSFDSPFEFDEDGKVTSFIGTFVDTTEKAREKDKIESELVQHAEALNEAAIISTTDPEGNILSVNEKFIEITGYSREELIGQNHRLLKSGTQPQGLFVGMWAAISSGKIWEGEICNRRKDGSLYWVQTLIYPFRNINGDIVKFLSVRFDISTTKFQTIELKEKSEKMKRVNEQLALTIKDLEAFSYSVSHDLKAPLRSLNGFSQNLLDKYGEAFDDRGKRWLEFIRDNAEQMDVLIGDILGYSKMSRKKLNRVQIDQNTMVQEIVEKVSLAYKHKKHELKILKLHSVYADPSLLTMVWQNLIENAFKYASKSERIVIEISSEEQDDEFLFSVKDNGIGFEMKYKEKVFGVFQRLHTQDSYEGTGVGLATVKRAVEIHGGTIDVHSEVNEGTTFSFKIPK